MIKILPDWYNWF